MGRSDKWNDVLRTSTVVQVLTRARKRSAIADIGMHRLTGLLFDRQWAQASVTVERLSLVADAVKAWFDRSILSYFVIRIVEANRSSYVFRWLTAEPDTDVIVIDLTESIVLGPFIAAIDAIADTFHEKRHESVVYELSERIVEFVDATPVRAASLVVLSAAVTSIAMSFAFGSPTTDELYVHLGIAFLAVIGMREETSLDDLRETRTAGIIKAVFEPPDPQGQRTQTLDQDPPSTDSPSESNGAE